MRITRLLFWCAVAYGVLLLLIGGAFPSGPSPSLSLAGVPLVVIAIIVVRDLAKRSAASTATRTIGSASGPKEDAVRFLSNQIRVAAIASDSYFENVVRARLKELLLTKTILETGLDRDAARRALSDPQQRLKLLHDEELYRLLYGPVPAPGLARMDMIGKAVDLIGAWKG